MTTESTPAIMQQNIALVLLFPSPTNPRKRFDSGKLNELAASIKPQRKSPRRPNTTAAISAKVIRLCPTVPREIYCGMSI